MKKIAKVGVFIFTVLVLVCITVVFMYYKEDNTDQRQELREQYQEVLNQTQSLLDEKESQGAQIYLIKEDTEELKQVLNEIKETQEQLKKSKEYVILSFPFEELLPDFPEEPDWTSKKGYEIYLKNVGNLMSYVNTQKERYSRKTIYFVNGLGEYFEANQWDACFKDKDNNLVIISYGNKQIFKNISFDYNIPLDLDIDKLNSIWSSNKPEGPIKELFDYNESIKRYKYWWGVDKLIFNTYYDVIVKDRYYTNSGILYYYVKDKDGHNTIEIAKFDPNPKTKMLAGSVSIDESGCWNSYPIVFDQESNICFYYLKSFSLPDDTDVEDIDIKKIYISEIKNVNNIQVDWTQYKEDQYCPRIFYRGQIDEMYCEVNLYFDVVKLDSNNIEKQNFGLLSEAIDFVNSLYK